MPPAVHAATPADENQPTCSHCVNTLRRLASFFARLDHALTSDACLSGNRVADPSAGPAVHRVTVDVRLAIVLCVSIAVGPPLVALQLAHPVVADASARSTEVGRRRAFEAASAAILPARGEVEALTLQPSSWHEPQNVMPWGHMHCGLVSKAESSPFGSILHFSSAPHAAPQAPQLADVTRYVSHPFDRMPSQLPQSFLHFSSSHLPSTHP